MQMCPDCSRDNPDTSRFCTYCGTPLQNLLGSLTLLQGRYRVQRVLGCGGMGAVYLAEDIRLAGGYVAVKENFDPAPQAQTQFQTEANILGNLKHSSLPEVTDYFIEPSGRQYLVMDYVEGDDLDMLIQHHGALAEHQVISWTDQVLDALECLHSQSPPIIHRDIKPANIKITPDDKAVLVDFGIAKLYDPRRPTTRAARAVTPGFSPPEQYGGGRTDARSDIYALGATLYAALTGATPPASTDLLVGVEKLAPPRQINPSLGTEVDQVILKAMALQPADRYQTTAEMRLALKQRPVPFRFRSGDVAKDVGDFLRLCDMRWQDAVHHLYSGDFEAWLAQPHVNQPALAQKTREVCVRASDPSRALEQFLRFAGRVAPRAGTNVAQLQKELDPRHVTRNRTRQATLEITNQGGRGYLFGTVRSLVPWLSISQTRFGCLPGQTAHVLLHVDPDRCKPTWRDLWNINVLEIEIE